MKRKLLYALFILSILLCIVGSQLRQPSAASAQTSWNIVWSDEFNGADNTLPDPTKWDYDLGGGGWGNRELEVYTNNVQNVHITSDPKALDGKALMIKAIKDANGKYTSARLVTRDNCTFQYGRFEIRAKIPYGQGMWPAIWLMGSNVDSVGWPVSGELDIMENVGRYPLTVYGNLHGPGYSGRHGLQSHYKLPNRQRFADAYHTFAIEWSADAIKWYVDDVLYSTKTPADRPAGTPWVFDHPFYLILNLAVGGSYPRYPDATTVFPQTFMVDYVRVYHPQT